jgi:adenine C2-methylase RlmN of 23S rRNA A2503 and tRNA A37
MAELATPKTNLLGLTRPGLEAFVVGMGEKPFRARQLMKWMYRRAVGDFESMTDLGKDFRQRLAALAEIRTPEVIVAQRSADGTRKWLLRLESGQAIEMVYIPSRPRHVVHLVQVGCVLDCSFCSTAQQGFNRNLSTAEIVGQVWLANRELGFSARRRAHHHQCGAHGNGRAAGQLQKRRACAASFLMTSGSICRADASPCPPQGSCRRSIVWPKR